MSVLVVGTVAKDSVITPSGRQDNILGGSATYFSLSASNFTMVRLVAVVGQDFEQKHIDLLKSHNIDHSGLEVTDGKTFHWVGEYQGDMNEAITHETHLNVLAEFQPKVPADFRSTPYVFLANIAPELQEDVLNQVERPKLVAMDTMNFWIDSKPEELKKVIGNVDLIVINDGEAKMLTGIDNLAKAAREIHSMGPRYVVIKRGEYGALMYSREGFFWAPAYPLEKVVDPTGAGDTFAGGMMGYITSQDDVSETTLRRALYYGAVMASYTVQDFSVEGLLKLSKDVITNRYKEFVELTRFDA